MYDCAPVPRDAFPSPRQYDRAADHGRPLRVLVVEDDRDTVLSLLALLREENHEARAVYKVADVWDAMDGFDPDMLLVDIGLPDRSGYELAQEIRKRFGEKHPVLIAVTAWNKSSDKILAKIAGFDEHVGKPYDPSYLLGLLNELKPN